MTSLADVEAALDVLRPSLAADGFELRAGDRTDDTIEVILAAKPEACLDCLVPENLMVEMIADAIRRTDPAAGEVRLVKEGFDDLPAH